MIDIYKNKSSLSAMFTKCWIISLFVREFSFGLHLQNLADVAYSFTIVLFICSLACMLVKDFKKLDIPYIFAMVTFCCCVAAVFGCSIVLNKEHLEINLLFQMLLVFFYVLLIGKKIEYDKSITTVYLFLNALYVVFLFVISFEESSLWGDSGDLLFYFDNPNAAGMALVVSMFGLIISFIRHKKWYCRLFNVGLMALIAYMIIKNNSRGAYGGFILLMLFSSMLMIMPKKFNKIFVSLWTVFMLLFPFIVVALYKGNDPKVLDILLKLLTGREEIWTTAFEKMDLIAFALNGKMHISNVIVSFCWNFGAIISAIFFAIIGFGIYKSFNHAEGQESMVAIALLLVFMVHGNLEDTPFSALFVIAFRVIILFYFIKRNNNINVLNKFID